MTIQVVVMASQARREYARLRTESAALSREMSSGFIGASNSLVDWGSKLQWASRQLTYNFTLPIAAAGAAATTFALKNEAAMVRVTKVYGEAGNNAQSLKKEVDALGGAFEALSNHFAVNQDEVIGIAGDWAAAGSTGIALAKAVRLTLETMVLGELEAADATQSLIAIQAQYGLTVDELAKSIDTLNMVENETGTTMGDLIESLARSAGAARSAGIDIQHLAALTAALTPAAGSAAQAGNGLKTIISRLLSPTKEATEVLGLMGINVKSLAWQSLNGVQRIEMMAKSFDKLGSSQRTVVSSVIASRWQINRFDILMRDVINTNGYYQKALNATSNAQANYNQRVSELNAVLSSNPQRLKQMWVILQNALADVIQPAIPLIIYLAQTVANLATAFSNIDPSIQKLTLLILGLLAAVGVIGRYVGATAILFGLLGRASFEAVRGVGALLGFMGSFARIPFAVIFAGITALSTSIQFLGGYALRSVILAAPATTSALSAIWTALLAFGTVVAYLGKAMLGSASLGAIMGSVSTLFTSILAQFHLYLFTIIPGVITKGVGVISGAFLRLGVMLQVVMMRVFAAGGVIAVIQNGLNTILYGVILPWLAAAQRAIAVGVVAMGAAMSRLSILVAQAMWAFRMIPYWVALGMGAGVKAAAAGAAALGRAIIVGLGAAVTAIPMLARTAFTGVVGILRLIGPAIIAFMTSPWGIAITLVVLALVSFKDKIADIWDSVVSYFKSNANSIGNIFRPVVSLFSAGAGVIENAFNRLPAAVARPILAVVNFIKRAALQVYEWFSYLNPFAHHSPSLVESVTNGMAVVAKQYNGIGNVSSVFSKAARDVENYKKLTSGLTANEWGSERADVKKYAPAALGNFDALVSDLGKLNAILDAQKVKVDAQSSVVDKWKERLDAANDALEVQQKKLDGLKGNLDKLQSAYDAHRDAMQNYADSGIQGQRAMSDAIFDNEQAQKKLRLEILKLEQAGGSVESIKNKMASLQGEIEKLRGQQADLRADGAGSDILGPLDSQITAMQDAYSKMGDSVNNSPVSKLQDELEKLRTEGERLDLENSLQFDGLSRQIDQLANGMKELPYDQIIAGINSEKSAMVALQPSIDQATAAVKAQQAVVDVLTDKRNVLSDTYDIERKKLEGIRDEYDKTKDSISNVEDALRSVSSAAADAHTKLGKKKEMSPGAENFIAATGANFADVGGFAKIGREGGWADQSKEIEKFTKDLSNETALSLGSFDMFGPIKKKWNEFTTWWSKNVSPSLSTLGKGVADSFSTIGDDVGKSGFADKMKSAWSSVEEFGSTVWKFVGQLGDLFGPQFKAIWKSVEEASAPVAKNLKEAWAQVGPIFEDTWKVLKPILMFLGGVVIAALSIAFRVLANIIGATLVFIAESIKNVLKFIRGVFDVIAGIFTGDFGRVFSGLGAMFSALWDTIISILKFAVKVIWGVVKGIIEGVVDFFKWLYDVLVGHSIIPDLVNAIVNWFKNLKDWVVNKVRDLVNAVVQWFKDLWTGSMDKLNALGNAIKEFWIAVRDGSIGKAQEILSGVVDKFQKIRTGVTDKITLLKNAAVSTFETMRDKMLGAFEGVRDKISGVMTDINKFIKTGINTGIGAVNKLVEGLNKVASVLPGLEWKIATIPLLAKGGQIPSKQVGQGFKTNGARAIVGEGKRAFPEYVIPTDPSFRKRAQMLYKELGKSLGIASDSPEFGIGGGLVDAIKSAASKGGDIAMGGIDWMKNAAKGAVSTVFSPFKGSVEGMIKKINWKFARGAAQSGLDKVWGWVTGADDAFRTAAESTAPGNGAWRKPTNPYTKSSGFGMRTNPVTGQYRLHAGVDLAAPMGQAIWAAAQGVAERASGGGYGNYVRVKHGGGYETVYGHMSAFAGKSGNVGAGDLIGKVGSTGNSTGPHLHFEVRKNGIPIDPIPFMRQMGVQLANGGIVKASRGGTLANIGEAGRDEAVVPLPRNWKQLSTLRSSAESKVNTMTVQRLVVAGRTSDTVQFRNGGSGDTYITINNPQFPNVKSGRDADDFLRNLDDLAGGK